LLKFTREGKFVLQIGKPGEANDSNATDRLGSPADVAVDVAAKEVFAADGYRNRRVAVFDSETGTYKRHWGAYPTGRATPRCRLTIRQSPPRSSSAIRSTAFVWARTS
jgi:DNA-binding beta-propeller fold protein YncE